MFAVIIPYYQTSAGVLRRAVESVAAQTEKGWKIIVVDDASPVSGHSELEGLAPDVRDHITLVRVDNGGPGRARNIGLDRAATMPGIDAVAFIDSDDHWASDHLARAKLALAEGEVYFCNYGWGHSSRTHFGDCGQVSAAYTQAIGDGDIRKLDGDFAHLILSKWPVHVSALCVRADCALGIRFDKRFYYSSEDQHYFLQLAARADKVYYDCKVGAILDTGMKFFAGNTRGDMKYTRLTIGNFLFHSCMDKELTLSEAARHVNRQAMRNNCKEIVMSEAYALLRRRRLNVSTYPFLLRTLKAWLLR